MAHKQNGSLKTIPLYKHVSRLLGEEISRNYKSGDILPPETVLANRYKVNRNTLRKAMTELVNEGVVGKIQGKGTIVLQKMINYSIHKRTNFTKTLEKEGRIAETIVLSKSGIPAEGELAEWLQVAPNEPVALVETLRKMDEIPFSLTSHYLPLVKVYDVIRLYKNGSLHHFLREHYGIEVERTVSMIRAVLPGKKDANTLGIMGTSPILHINSINVDSQTGQPIEVAVSRFKGISTQLLVEPARCV